MWIFPNQLNSIRSRTLTQATTWQNVAVRYPAGKALAVASRSITGKVLEVGMGLNFV